MPRSSNHQKGGTLALRIQFKGLNGHKVLCTNQDDVQSLVPWLKTTMSSLQLPHPKPTNVLKSPDASSTIDMFWDAENVDVLERNVTNRFRKIDRLILQQMSIDHLMVFALALNRREISSWEKPVMQILCPFDNPTSVGSSSFRGAPAELEDALLKMFESLGVSIPTPVENIAAYVPQLSVHVQMLRSAVDSEMAARKRAEEALAEERTRHARLLQEIQAECREPFVVPALLDAFVAVSEVVDGISEPEAG